MGGLKASTIVKCQRKSKGGRKYRRYYPTTEKEERVPPGDMVSMWKSVIKTFPMLIPNRAESVTVIGHFAYFVVYWQQFVDGSRFSVSY